MHYHKLVLALALVAPVAAIAQERTAQQPVTLELIAMGEVEAPATSFTLSVSYTATGKTQVAAERERDAKSAAVLKLLQAQGVPASAVEESPDPLITFDVTPPSEEAETRAEGSGFHAGADRKVRVTSMAQAKAVRSALEVVGATVSDVKATLDPTAAKAARRQAKVQALANAREDAAAYAAQMGLRVLRIVRISEVGSGLLPPGLQGQLEKAMTKGPRGLVAGLPGRPGTIEVSAGVIVEFVLAP